MTEDLRQALARAARAPTLLVAVDFDGTLSQIVDEPDAAEPVPGAVEALELLAAEAGVVVALVSGRLRAELEARSGAPEGVMLVGAHGAEVAAGTEPHPQLADVAEAVERELVDTGAKRIERKPATVTVHTRSLGEEEATEVTRRVIELGHQLGHRVETGKSVVEIHLSSTTKGTAVERLRRQHGAEAVVYVGDDTTDEEAFGVLGSSDVGMKVGAGNTRAGHRLADPLEVVSVLRLLAELRRDLRPSGGR